MTQHQTFSSTTTPDPAQRAGTETQFVGCPECAMPATVEWRSHISSTAGPLEHLKIRCASGHWFLLPASMVPGQTD